MNSFRLWLGECDVNSCNRRCDRCNRYTFSWAPATLRWIIWVWFIQVQSHCCCVHNKRIISSFRFRDVLTLYALHYDSACVTSRHCRSVNTLLEINNVIHWLLSRDSCSGSIVICWSSTVYFVCQRSRNIRVMTWSSNCLMPRIAFIGQSERSSLRSTIWICNYWCIIYQLVNSFYELSGWAGTWSCCGRSVYVRCRDWRHNPKRGHSFTLWLIQHCMPWTLHYALV